MSALQDLSVMYMSNLGKAIAIAQQQHNNPPAAIAAVGAKIVAHNRTAPSFFFFGLREAYYLV